MRRLRRSRDRGYALDALVVVREADHERVRHLYRTDACGVTHAGADVDENVVILRTGCLLHRIDEATAAEPIVEVLPVESANGERVVIALAAGGKQVDLATRAELRKVDRDDVVRKVGE